LAAAVALVALLHLADQGARGALVAQEAVAEAAALTLQMMLQQVRVVMAEKEELNLLAVQVKQLTTFLMHLAALVVD
jgi:hypothetical protein